MIPTTASPVDAPAATSDTGFLQLLTPDGRRRHAAGYAEYEQAVVDVGHEQLRELLADLTIIRRIDAEATALQRQGELGLWPPLLGQEAAQIGSARALLPNDFAFGSYREHGVAWVRGATIGELMPAWRGTEFCGWDPTRIRTAPGQVVIGTQTLHAVGYAMGARWEGSDDAVIAYLGDGAMSKGDVAEAMVFAATFQAPVVFFVQNNQWAISEPVELQSRIPLASRAPGFGIPSVRVDGNDVLAVIAATRVALSRARRGEGPTMIEAITYRMGPHTTADDPTRYRAAEELEHWARRDPITRLETVLREEGALDDEQHAGIRRRADAAATELRERCLALPDPAPLSIFDHVYAAPHPRIDEQRDRYRAYLEGFE